MAGAGKKTFTAGEVLTASDTNTYLMEQTVMYFAGTAARSSAIPTPSTGMTTYIGTTGTATIPQLETYTGSAWQTPYGLTQIANVSFTSAASVSLDNVFTSAYANYKVEIFVSAVSTVLYPIIKFRDAGGNVNLTNYAYRSNSSSSAGTGSDTNAFSRTQDGAYISAGGTGELFAGSIDIFSPNLATKTLATSHATVQVGNLELSSFSYQATTQMTGFSFLTSTGTFTGTIRVYGYRNS